MANKTLQEKFWSHLRELDFVLRAMGRNLGTVSKGVKDLWLLCGEREGREEQGGWKGQSQPLGGEKT